MHLQAILKRSLKPTCAILPLMKRGHANNLEFFLSHVGKMFMNGFVFKPLYLLQFKLSPFPKLLITSSDITLQDKRGL